jgi:trehalose 6-phosphate synthase
VPGTLKVFSSTPAAVRPYRALLTAAESPILIVSNRLPVHRVDDGQGAGRWETSPGGLVSALKSVLQDRPSTWIGWTGVAGEAAGAPFELDGIRNHPVALNREDIADYYEGFSNRTLWPLYHDAVRAPEFRRSWWNAYMRVNERFAAAAAEAAAPGSLVWVHDYHLQLVPSMLRGLRPDVRIGFFLHIPFPPQELFAQLPWRSQLLEGMLGADVVGFQTRVASENFTQLCGRYLDVRERGAGLGFRRRVVSSRAFPISVDFAQFEEMAGSPGVESSMAAVRARLGERRVILGVDRLDYTKGIDVRLEAFSDLLESGTCSTADTVFVQVAVPTREHIEEYQDVRGTIEQAIGRINGRFGEVGRAPIHYLHRGVPPEELVALYRLADVMTVTPYRDGMNLVAKEFVASRTDESGVLVLSEFTGAAKELTEALLVNPHDIDGVAAAIRGGLGMKQHGRVRRMRAMRSVVRQNDVHRWARSFFEELGS